MFILADETDVFVFCFGDGPIGTPRAIYQCVISRDALVLYSDPVLSIPTSQIRLVHEGMWLRDGRVRVSCVTVKTEETSYSFWPVNPMRPILWSYDNFDEGVALKAVLTSLWRHQKPEYDKNPYRRQQIAKRKRKIIDLDAEVSPREYWRQGRLWSKPFLQEFVEATWLIAVAIAFIAIMALAVNWLNG